MLDHKVKYTINSKALEKWSTERLILKKSEDDTIKGIFRYEGTTCSNLGHKLEFLYTVILTASVEGFRIISLNCTPVDDGYKYMCEYLRNPEFMREIADEKPLLGRNLDSVLNWQKQFSPEGCYCKAESRCHKWGIVFEVLHYALVKQEKNLIRTNKFINSLEK